MTRNATPVPFSADLDELPVPVRAIIGASQYLWSDDNNNNTNNHRTKCLVYWSCQLSRKGANQSSCIVACCTAGSGPEGSKPILVLYLRKMQNTWKISGLAIPLLKKPSRKGEAHSHSCSLLWISQGTPWTSNSAGQPKALALPHIVHARYRIVKVVQPPCPLHSASSENQCTAWFGLVPGQRAEHPVSVIDLSLQPVSSSFQVHYCKVAIQLGLGGLRSWNEPWVELIHCKGSCKVKWWVALPESKQAPWSTIASSKRSNSLKAKPAGHAKLPEIQ